MIGGPSSGKGLIHEGKNYQKSKIIHETYFNNIHMYIENENIRIPKEAGGVIKHHILNMKQT